MCSRFVFARLARELAAAADATVPDGVTLPEPSWNVAPTDTVPIVVQRTLDGEIRRELHPARWGLIPPWATDTATAGRTVNARIETVAQKPSFAAAVRSRRCLVLADGYYEWQRLAGPAGERKQPLFIHSASGEPIQFAGVYSWWADPEFDRDDPARWILTTSILTCPATGDLARIHDRMPVALTPAACEDWLDTVPVTQLPDLLAQVRGVADQVAATWAYRVVAAAIGSVRASGPQLIDEVRARAVVMPGGTGR